jgi:uncharacterized membrane protein
MDLAPVEYVVIGFEGDRVDAHVLPPLRALVDGGLIRILDVVVVRKDPDGAVAYFEPETFGDGDDALALAALSGTLEGMISEEDVAEAAQSMDADSTAIFAIVEDLWAAELGAAILGHGGRLLIGERIPAEDVAAAAAIVAGQPPE